MQNMQKFRFFIGDFARKLQYHVFFWQFARKLQNSVFFGK